MHLMNLRVLALAAVAWTAGCTPPMPNVRPVAQLAEQVLEIGDPFVDQTTGEPLDVVEARGRTALSLDDAVRLALRHNAEIQSALARVRQAESDSRQTRLLPNPVIGVAIRFPESGTSIIDADISAELLSLITRPGRISAADSRLRKATAEALKIVLDVVVEVQTSYAAAQAIDARVKLGDERRATLHGLVEITNARLRAGEAARLDVLTAQSELSALDSELLALRAERRLARIAIARLIGQPSAEAEWTLAPWSVRTEPVLSESEWIGLALEHRPELAAIRWELAALGHEVRFARNEVLTGGGGLAAERDDAWSVGPSLSIPVPIFDTGDVARQRRQHQASEQRHQLTQTGRLVIEEVRRTLQSLAAARAGLDRVQSELLPLQQQRLRVARESYRAGQTDMLALRLAEHDLQQARARIIELQQQVLRARFELDRAVGGSGAYRDQPSNSGSTTLPATRASE